MVASASFAKKAPFAQQTKRADNACFCASLIVPRKQKKKRRKEHTSKSSNCGKQNSRLLPLIALLHGEPFNYRIPSLRQKSHLSIAATKRQKMDTTDSTGAGKKGDKKTKAPVLSVCFTQTIRKTHMRRYRWDGKVEQTERTLNDFSRTRSTRMAGTLRAEKMKSRPPSTARASLSLSLSPPNR